MVRILYEFLRWLPIAVFGAALALASAFGGFANWLAGSASAAFHDLSNPWNAALSLVCLAVYLGTLIWSGSHVSRDRPRLVAKIRHLIYNVRDPISGEWQLVVELEIRNTGNMPSAIPLESWRIALVVGPDELSTKIVAVVTPFAVHQAPPGQPLVFHPQRSIHEVMRTPLAGGSIEYGYAYALLANEVNSLLPVSRGVRVYFEDILGRVSRAHFPMNSPAPLEGRFYASAHAPSTPLGATEQDARS